MTALKSSHHITSPINVPEVNHDLDEIHVTLGVYDPTGKYSQHAGVVMTSIFENTHNPVTVHILHDETLTEDNKNKFIRTAEKYNQKIDLIDVRERVKKLPKHVINFFREQYSSLGTFYRFFIFDLLKFDKIIYLDCDIVVNLDIKELWQIDIKNYCLAAILDKPLQSTPKFSQYAIGFKMYNMDIASYFNAGVIVFNLSEIRKLNLNIIEEATKYFKRYSHILSFSDQDFLNAFFHDSVKLIDEKFNKFNRFLPVTDEEAQNIIMHTTPYEFRGWAMHGKIYQKYYWLNYLKSAWGENKSPAEMVEILTEAANIPQKIQYSKFMSIYTRSIKHIKGIFKLLTAELKYRITHKN